MFKRVFGVVIVCLATTVFAATTPVEMDLHRQKPVSADSVIPVTDFFRNVYMADPTINESGTHIAARVSGGAAWYQLMVIDRLEGTQKIVRGKGDMDIYHPRWLSNDRISYMLSTDKLKGIGLMVVPLAHIDRSYPIQQYGGPEVIGVPTDMRPLIWQRWDDRGLAGNVMELDARRKSGSLINLWDNTTIQGGWSKVMEMNAKYIKKSYPAPNRDQAWRYLTDRNDHLALAFTVKAGISQAHYWTGNAWGASPFDLDKWSIFTMGNRPNEVVVRENQSEGKPGALYFANVVTGKIGEMILRNKQYDFDGSFFRDPKSRNLVGAEYNDAGPRMVWFDKSYQALQKTLNASFPGQVVRLLDSNKAGTVFLLRVWSDRHPQAYYVIDLKKHSLDLVAESRPWLDPKRMRPQQIMKYKTAEGRELDAYITLPAGATKANPPPLVVLPHGGPWVRDVWGFDAEAQFLASRGYAVLQPNYRGSPGYDWMFPYKDRWDFLKMHDDVTRAARTLIASGLVDGDRVAIAGGSFGGYLALMGAVHEPDLYRCAVTFAGVFDWEEMIKMKELVRYERTNFQVLMRYLGNPAKNPDMFARISPGRQVGQIKIPIFVAHGKEDTIVPVKQSHQLIAELKRHHIKYESLILSHEGHGTYHIEDAVKYHSDMVAFLKKHL